MRKYGVGDVCDPCTNVAVDRNITVKPRLRFKRILDGDGGECVANEFKESISCVR